MADLRDVDPGNSPADSDEPRRIGRLRRALRRITALQPRTHWWNLIDYLEARPRLVRRVGIGLVAAALIGLGGGFAYVRWHRLNSIRVARQWLAAGRLDRAQPAIQTAIAELPLRPEPWELASALAWARGQKLGSLAYAEHAAQASQYQFPYVLAWAETAVLANQTADAQRALDKLDPKLRSESSRAERVAGEIARQQNQYAVARDHFAAALKLDAAGPVKSSEDRLAIDEVPLGLMELRTGVPADHRQALATLERWASDPRWGADALRDLLADALQRKDRTAAVRWAEALRAHPRCAIGDLPTCLLALSTYDPKHYEAMVRTLQTQFAEDPNRIAMLMGWLTQIGRPEDGLRWSRTLPATLTEHQPVAIAIAEALRITAQWAALAAWVNRDPWGPDTEFLRSMYRLEAAHALGDQPTAALAWKALQDEVRNRGDFAMFAGANLYVWGLHDEAITVLWMAADHPNVALEALGTILRNYQVLRDAAGEYRAFRRLYALRPQDRDIAHDLVFFAVLSGQYDYALIERLARENFQHDPNNPLYRANYAFLLDSTGRNAEALALLEPKAGAWRTNQGFAFAYGLALAHAGRKEQARPILATIDQRPISRQERELIQAAVR